MWSASLGGFCVIKAGELERREAEGGGEIGGECSDISNTWSQQSAAAAASRQPGIFIKTTFGDKN